MIGYVDEVIRPLVLILPKMSGYVKTLKVKNGYKDKNHKLMSFHINGERLLEKHKTIWTNINNLKYIKSKNLPVYNDRYIKTKLWAYNDKVYTNFHLLNVPEMLLNRNLLQSFLMILYLFMKTNITYKYI